MLVKKIEDFSHGIFLGDYDRVMLESEELCSSILSYKLGDHVAPYYWKTSTEILTVISGQVQIFDQTWGENDIIVVEPEEIVDIQCLEDAQIVSIVFPGKKNDKQELSDMEFRLLKKIRANISVGDSSRRLDDLQRRIEELQYQVRLLSPPEEDIYGRFSFPWRAIAPGSRIVLYGGGVVGRLFLRQISRSSYCHVVAICDRNPAGTGIREIPVITPTELAGWKSSTYDTILVAIEREDISREIRQQLEWSGIPSKKIKWINPARV